MREGGKKKKKRMKRPNEGKREERDITLKSERGNERKLKGKREMGFKHRKA